MVWLFSSEVGLVLVGGGAEFGVNCVVLVVCGLVVILQDSTGPVGLLGVNVGGCLLGFADGAVVGAQGFFLITAVGFLASSVTMVFPDLGVSSISVVPFLVAMFGSLVLTISYVSSAGFSLVLSSLSPQVHQVMLVVRKLVRVCPLAEHLQFEFLTPPSVSLHFPHALHQLFQKVVWLSSHHPFRGESCWRLGVLVPVGAGSSGRPLLALLGLYPSLLSPAGSNLACQSLLLGPWGLVVFSAFRCRNLVCRCGGLTRSRSGLAFRFGSPIRLFGCFWGRWCG